MSRIFLLKENQMNFVDNVKFIGRKYSEQNHKNSSHTGI